MADPKNPFISAYIGTLNEESPFYKGANPTTGFNAYGKPTSGLYNYDIGPTADPLFKEESGLRQQTDDYLGSLFQPAQTTEDYVAANPLTEGINIPSSSGVIGRPQAENTAQAGKRQSNYIQDAFNSVQELMQGGKAIPSSMESAMRPQQYNYIERDIRGNIIGASGRMQFDPTSGAPVGKITPDWKADTGGLGRPYTPGLDAFKQAQVESAKTSQEAASTPAALQSQANREAYLQSKQQQGANVVAGIKAGREAAGFNPETGVWSPREQGMPNTYEMKNAALKQTALNKSIEQGFGDKTNIYGQAYQGMPTQGKTIFGEHGYVQSYPANQSSTASSRALTKGLTEAELKKAKQQQA